MGKYYCDYCDIYLTHDSMSARKAHNTGRNHISNVRDYFASLGHDTAQSIIDQIVQSHENGGRAAMMAAPSMRIGAGFMNPMGPGMPHMTQQNNYPPPVNTYQPPSTQFGGPPPFRPPFPPTNPGFTGGQPMTLPPFPPQNGFRPPPMGMPGMPPPTMAGPPGGFQPMSMGPGPIQGGGLGNGSQGGSQGGATPGGGGGGGGIHPDRLRMMGV